MVHKVLPPLRIGDNGEQVVNLQDALRFLVDKGRLKIDDPSEKEKLLRGLSGERDRQFFGDNGTLLLVSLFQDQRGLSTTGEIDISTADALNQLLSVLGAFDRPPQIEFVVRGQVQFANGRVATGMTLCAYDRDLRSEEKLGDTITNEEGRYQIKYTADQFSRAEKGSADLRVAVCEPGGRELVSSEIQFNAPAEITINLSLPSAPPEPSEYERYLAALEPVLQGLSLAELREDDEQKDITFLTGETGLEHDHIFWLVKAAQSADWSLPVEFFYGCFRLGLPTDVAELMTRTDDELTNIIGQAVEGNIIPLLSGERIKALVQTLRGLA